MTRTASIDDAKAAMERGELYVALGGATPRLVEELSVTEDRTVVWIRIVGELVPMSLISGDALHILTPVDGEGEDFMEMERRTR